VNQNEQQQELKMLNGKKCSRVKNALSNVERNSFFLSATAAVCYNNEKHHMRDIFNKIMHLKRYWLKIDPFHDG
jgi:phosphoribosyl-dephospho-CoA transferase